MSSLTIWLLGPPRIECEDTSIEIGRRKAVALLVYLAMTRQSYHRDELATLLWPASNQSRARGNLRHVLSGLNQVLGPSWLDREGETVGLKQDIELWLDVAHFRHQLAACHSHDHPADEVCPACLPLLTEAVALYCNDFLAGFTLRNSPEFDEWQFFQTESLRQELATALERLVRGYSAQKEFEAAISYARRWLALDPLYEPVHCHLMQLYAQSGQRAAALRQYQECARILGEELDVLPQAETIAMYEHIQAGEAGQAEPLFPISQFSGPSPPPHNLPASLTPFVGRKAELAKIKEHLQDPARRLLTLVGPGGIGKTRLALEAAATQLNHFTHGVYFVSLAPLQTVEAIVPTVANALDFSFYEKEEPQQQLLDYLRQKNILLIMDNFEHLLIPTEEKMNGGAELVVEMLRAVPDLKILTTSRARLNVKGEHLFSVAGMDFPDEETTEDVAQYSAIQLFLQSARRTQPNFDLTTGNLTDVVQVCRLVEGMPLAILLAAAWVEMLTPAEIVTEVKQSIDFLETDWGDVPERQRSLRAVFDYSWRLLTKQERQVFQALSVFRGGFTREAAQAGTGASLRTLLGLINKSLLQRTSAGRYGMHELLRQYAAEKLEASGETDTARDAHSAYYAEFLHQREADLNGRRQLEALDEIEVDFENARAAWNWVLKQKNYAAIGQLSHSLSWFCIYRSHDQEYKELYRQARKQLAPGPDDEDDDETHLVWVRILVGEFFARPREVDRTQIERGLAIAQKYSNRKLMAVCLRALGAAASNADDHIDALSFYEVSLTHSRALDDSLNIAATLYLLAETYRLLGQPDKAITFARQSLDLSRKIGDKYWAARSLANTGTIALYTGNYAEAEDYLQEANTIYCELGNKEGIASSSVDLGKIAFLKGGLAEAKTLTEEALEIATDLGNKPIAQSARDFRLLVASALGEKTDEHPDDGKLPHTINIPPTINRFKIKKLLGVGSGAFVYLAHDPDSGRNVALKVLNPELFDWASSYFNRGAKIMAKLAHPAIPKYYGYGETADSAFIALEYIDGNNLEEILDKQKGFLPEKVVIKWALQLCDALTYLHSQRPEPLIFCEVMPANVMVDHSGKVYLVDYGAMTAYQAGRERVIIRTSYSPPEQYIGYSNPRSDIYALGATLHHLFTRRDPRKETPFSFHKAPPRSLNPTISEELAAVILKATEYKAEDRYQSAAEMKAALLACQC